MKLEFDIDEFVDYETQQAVICNLVNRVRARRKECKLTQKQLAERSGVSYASLRRFEQTGEISFRALVAIAKELKSLQGFNQLFKTPNITNLQDFKS